MHNPKVDWCFHTEKDESMNNRSIRYPRGKTLGGSSSINGLLWIRGQSNKIMIIGDSKEIQAGVGMMYFLIF